MESNNKNIILSKSERISNLVSIFEPKEEKKVLKASLLKKNSVEINKINISNNTNNNNSINNINSTNNQNKDINKEDIEEFESDEETDSKEIEQKTKKSDKPKYNFDGFNEEEIKKINDLKKSTEENISKTVKNKKNANLVKALVSKKKNRFTYDGFDLDLTYITPKIIAMGIPSTNFEGLYRNTMEDIQRFLNTRHPSHYKVYNLCEERSYPKNSFYKQEVYPFKDHEAPPLNMMKSFCIDAKKFLEEDNNNIIAVHCKAGKGRTGTMICCLLLYMNTFPTAKECLQYYGMMRTDNGKGVTIPSQIRYVNYFEQILKLNMDHPVVFKKKIITKIRMFTLPMFHKVYTPFFKIENNGHEYNSSEKNKTDFKKEDLNAVVDFDIDKGFLVEGDVKLMFYRSKLFTKNENIFKFWFNTNFIPYDCNIYQFKKDEIDKACKDKTNKFYKPEFKIEIHFVDV